MAIWLKELTQRKNKKYMKEENTRPDHINYSINNFIIIIAVIMVFTICCHLKNNGYSAFKDLQRELTKM